MRRRLKNFEQRPISQEAVVVHNIPDPTLPHSTQSIFHLPSPLFPSSPSLNILNPLAPKISTIHHDYHLSVPHPKQTTSRSRQPHTEPISSGTRIGSSEGGIAPFPGSTGAEAETNPGRPGSSLEEQHREDDPEGKTHARADQEGGEAVVPLLISVNFGKKEEGAMLAKDSISGWRRR